MNILDLLFEVNNTIKIFIIVDEIQSLGCVLFVAML